MNETDDLPIFERSPCPVANVLDLFGDKWTLLVVRDLLLGKTRYGEFAQSPEGIPTNILADRLKKLGEAREEGVLREALAVRVRTDRQGPGSAADPGDHGRLAQKHVPGSRVFPR